MNVVLSMRGGIPALHTMFLYAPGQYTKNATARCHGEVLRMQIVSKIPGMPGLSFPKVLVVAIACSEESRRLIPDFAEKEA